MNTKEVDDRMIENQNCKTKAIMIENGTFCWGSNEPIALENINMEIKKGSLTVVSSDTNFPAISGLPRIGISRKAFSNTAGFLRE